MLVAGATDLSGSCLPSLAVGSLTLSNQSLQRFTLTNLVRATSLGIYDNIVQQPAYGWGYCNASLASTPAGFDLYAEAAHFQPYCGANVVWGHYWSADGTNWMIHAKGLNNPTSYPGIRARFTPSM